MFLSSIYMTSAPSQRFTETGAEFRLAQLSKEHLNGNGGNSATLPLCRLSAQPCDVCRDRSAGQQDHLCRCGHFSRHSGRVWFPLVLCTQKMLTIPFHFCFSLSGRSFWGCLHKQSYLPTGLCNEQGWWVSRRKRFLGFNYMKTSMNECMNIRRTY